MSVARPETAASYTSAEADDSIQPIASRTSSVSSYRTNYSASTAPTAYSSSSPASSYRQFDSVSSIPKFTEPVQRRVPQEVYEVIIHHLEELHKGQHQTGCTTCFQRDLHALSLTCRSWERAVRGPLYNSVHIVGNDSPAQLKKYRLKRGSRLKLLRRTLRERKLLANLVYELRVPQLELLFTTTKQSTQWQEYRDLVASVVMVCPNLERLLGLSIPYHHEFDRLTHALSTRKKLKEHTWVLGEAAAVSEGSPRDDSCPGSLGPSQMFEFLDYHTSWSNLETLMLYGLNGNGALEPSVSLRMFNLLPSLRNLCVSSFDKDSFDDSTLLCLPPLESLRLENLPGITETGLTQYASRSESSSLKTLVLVEQNIESLLAISKILSSLRSLERFKIVQTEKCPTLPDEDMIFQPILASSTLKYLHWDVACPDPHAALTQLDTLPFQKSSKPSNTPNSHLAQSIISAGFPELEALRAPSDVEPPGVLQAACRPITKGQALLRPDRYSLPRSSHGSVNTRPLALPAGNNLTSARIRAQTFIDMAAKDTESGMPVLIQDWSDGFVPDNAQASQFEEDPDQEMDDYGIWAACARYKHQENDHSGPKTVYQFNMPTFMGRSGMRDPATGASIPHLVLRPDITGQESDGGLIGWKQLLASNQSLSYAAGVGVNCFGSDVPAPPPPEEINSPASTTSKFGWGSLSGRSMMGTSPTTPTTPITPMSSVSGSVLPWDKDTCTGSWNHKTGRDWWFHMERDRPSNSELIDIKQLF
ncbi:unnamed protein product [Penicillium salamii]|uniref:F-box domain-containing protein n=1 Tax=Penicillium salamii TaxID=1612424 RepID=A0A9W4IS96_9EURO|nr:unnamed protein product [Penicillium salamii]CAG7999825.1 unnamed protein product [Penicillium salamii]CAG8048053.1 unnamed protein product [Penicillium salamii]CAG8063920.1 unnamed protein product [Penicillium salamii]CAG8227608.1 unnamed protein product [Penicillium salamii]